MPPAFSRSSLAHAVVLLSLVTAAACTPTTPDDTDPTFEASLELWFSLPNVAVAFDVASDGRIFYTERDTGKVRTVRDGVILDPPELTLAVNGSSGERGLLGLALHPDFDTNGQLYVYYSRSASGNVVNDFADIEDIAGIRVARLHVEDDIVVGPEEVIVDFPVAPLDTISHFAGNIHFGPNGKLFITRGDLSVSPNAQDIDATAGKILRYNDDGTIPEDNPFGPDSPVWALGVRNSFDFAFDPVTDVIFATENSTNAHDELNRIVPGGNYGWPLFEATTERETTTELSVGKLTEPLLDLAPEAPAVAPTGIEFLRDDRYGPGTTNDLVYAEFVTGLIWRVRLNEARDAVVERTVFVDLSTVESPGPIELFFDGEGTLIISNGFRVYRVVANP